MTVVPRAISLLLVVLAADALMEAWARRARSPCESVRTRLLRRRLDNAGFHWTPGQWRWLQCCGAVPLATLLVLGGATAVAAALTASSAVRLVAALTLRLRRGRLAGRLERSAATVARCVASELREGTGAGRAFERVARSEVVRADPEVEWLFRTITSRRAVGDDVATAVNAAVGAACDRVDLPLPALRAMGASVSAHVGSGAGRGDSLRRLADVLDDDRRGREQTRAVLAEPRVAAFAVPAVTAGVLAMIFTADHAAAGVVSTRPGLVAIAMCGTAGACGLGLVARLTR